MGKSSTCTYRIGDKQYKVHRNEDGRYYIYVPTEDGGDTGENYLSFETEKKALKFILSAFKDEESRSSKRKEDLNSLTWEKIAEYAESGKAAEVFEIGDTKDFTLTTGEKCRAVILDFNHDTLASDVGQTAGITFGMLNSLEGAYSMNNEWTNEGGYANSKMFEKVQRVFYDKLPDDIKQHIKCVEKNEEAETGEFYAKAFLFSEVEVFGTTDYSYKGEGRQYPLFEKEENRIKKLGEDGEAYFWWLRSPWSGYTAIFCSVRSDGTLHSNHASSARGLSAGFCI